MSQPLDNILKAINDHAEPRTETRRLPNWFTLVYEEDYRTDGCGVERQDPATGEDVTGCVKGKPKSNKKGGG